MEYPTKELEVVRNFLSKMTDEERVAFEDLFDHLTTRSSFRMRMSKKEYGEGYWAGATSAFNDVWWLIHKDYDTKDTWNTIKLGHE